MERSVPKRCIQWRVKLANGYLHNMLQQEQQELITHIATCSSCASVWAEYQAMDAAINNLPSVRPLAEQPVALAALINKNREEEIMLTDNQNHEDGIKVTDLGVQPAWEQRRASEREGRRSKSRLTHLVSSLAAVLVVSFIATGSFLFFANKPSSNLFEGDPAPIPKAVGPILYTSQEPPGPVGNVTIYAVDSANGRTLWRTELKTKLTTAELLPHKGLLFAPGYDGNLYALSAKNGEVLWKYTVEEGPASTSSTYKSVPSSPIASGNAVYFGAKSGFYALDIETGKLLWHIELLSRCRSLEQTDGIPITCAPIIGTVANDIVYAYFDGLYALDAKTGKELWHDLRFQAGGPGSIVVTGDNIYATSLSNDFTILNATNGKEVMKVPDGATSPSTTKSGGSGGILLVDGVVYHVDENGLQAISGTKILWSKPYQAQPIAGSAGTVFVTSFLPLDGPQKESDIGTYFYALDARTGAIKWSWGEQSSSNGGAWGPGYPLSFDGKLYFFFPVQQDGKWIESLWVLHDGKRDLYPLNKG